MSVQVNYKNNQLTAFSNTTKILKTSGKYMEDDITITETSNNTPAISIVDTPDSGGGDIRTITALDISDTTATASDVAQGKYFYTAQGVKTAGSASGGSSAQSDTGTFVGSGTIQQQISCSFAPDLIYVYGDLSVSASYRGVVSLVIIKDTELMITVDGSTGGFSEYVGEVNHSLSGYGDSSSPHATYSNGTLTLDMVTDSNATRFSSSVTYSYKLAKWS
jgi:hypothetical protein